MLFILYVCLLTVAQAAIFSKLSSFGPSQLTNNDYLISTLGTFRLTLNPNTCQLQLQNFTSNSYGIVGYYPRDALKPCSSVNITQKSLKSNNNQLLFSLLQSQKQANYEEIYMTIDEMGIVRMNGVFFNQFQTAENWVSIFRTPQPYIFSISDLNVNNFQSLSFIQNRGNWGFSATKGQLRIFRVDNVSRITRYNYNGFTITPNNLFDYNSNTLPQADFKMFQYNPTCAGTGFKSFQGPFVFQISSYWPELRLLDRTGYQIISIRYPMVKCWSNLQISELKSSPECMQWFCPQNTFEHKGNCLATCPSPYYQQLHSNGMNRCVLNCVQGFTRDISTRVCACGSPRLMSCPLNTQPTPLGCLCFNGTYFNAYNQRIDTNKNYCQKTCGPFLYAHEDGICVPCQKFCINCVRSNTSYGYLRCVQCAPQYVLKQNFCIKECIKTKNNSSSRPTNTTVSSIVFQSNICLTCTDKFCLTCLNNSQRCQRCSRPYSLHVGRCLVQCPRGFKSQFITLGFFECRVINGCNSLSMTTTGTNNQSACFCIRNGFAAYQANCQSDTPEQCQIDQYYSNSTRECLACPVGCLTCSLDNSSRVQCTSCRPAYSLFVNLFQNSYCQRNSIITKCPNSFDKISQICSLTELVQIVFKTPSRMACFANVSNCAVCLNRDTQQCSICVTGFFLYQGLCYKQCPQKTYPYQFQRVCINQILQNCQSQFTQSIYWIFEKNRINQFADGYFYMLTVNFQNTDPLNDPLGILFQYNRNQANAIDINIASSQASCRKCKAGFGINVQGTCSPCVPPCAQCVFVSEKYQYCLKCQDIYRLNDQNQCVELSLRQLSCRTGQYRNQSLICQKGCSGFIRQNFQFTQKNKSYLINCTFNCPASQNVVKISDNLGCQKGSSVAQTIKFLGSIIRLDEIIIYMFMSQQRLQFSQQSQVLKLYSQSKTYRLLQQQTQVHMSPLGFVIVSQHSKTIQSLIFSLQSSNIVGQSISGEKYYLGNSLYGFDHYSKSMINVLTDQTYNLYMYGRAYVILLIIATVIFLARQINYKTDNVMITFGVVYLILPSLNLSADPSAFNTYSFMYGFAWSTFLQFFSNPRFFTRTNSLFQNGYLQKVENNAHYLLFIDNNCIRNVWSILLMLIIAIGILGIALVVMKGCAVRKDSGSKYSCSRKGYSWIDIDHSQSVQYMLLFFIQTSFLGLVYYFFINLFNQQWVLAPSFQSLKYKIISIIFLSIIAIFSSIRFYVNRIGGIYCLKRILLGCVLGVGSMLGGIDRNIPVVLGLLIAVECIFVVLRYRYELITNYLKLCLCPQKKIQLHAPQNKLKSRHTMAQRPSHRFGGSPSRRQTPTQEKPLPQRQKFWSIVIQQGIIIIIYIFATFLPTLKEISVILIWILFNVFMVVIGLQLLQLALQSWNRSVNHQQQSQQEFVHHLKTVWNHQATMKSLKSTSINDF